MHLVLGILIFLILYIVVNISCWMTPPNEYIYDWVRPKFKIKYLFWYFTEDYWKNT